MSFNDKGQKKTSCRLDMVSLGEVMLSFDRANIRIWDNAAFFFEVSEGGGEVLGELSYKNVARDIEAMFSGLETAIVTHLQTNPVGFCCWQGLILPGG